MDWKDVAKVVSTAAPLLGSLLGGPQGAAVGTAIKLIASALGVGPEPDEVMEAIKTDPDALVKVKELELKHQEELAKLALEQAKLELKAELARLADVDSARRREVEVTRATGKRDVNLYVLAWTVVAGFFGLCFALMKVPLPEGSNDVVFMLFGTLATGFGMVLQYFFGSSKSSAEKTKLLVGRRDVEA